MGILVNKILKRKSEKQVEAEIKNLKAAVKKRFNLSKFNIPEAESCISFMQKLIIYSEAKSIMKSTRYKAYLANGRKGNFSDFN